MPFHSDSLNPEPVPFQNCNKKGVDTLYNFNITSFAPNGDVLASTDTANGNWTYTYDAFNRLVGSNKNSGQSVFSYVYDRFGNRWQQNGPQTFIATFTGNNPGNPQNNNRIDGYSYDAAGNLLGDGLHTYTYDAENRLIKVDNGNTATYSYDADGRRAQKLESGLNWQYTYNLSGQLMKIFNGNASGTFMQGNFFAGARHVATIGGGTTFNHSDWLGTERVRVYYQNGAICESTSSLPFGDGQTITGTCYNSSNLHFTGKERDPESGLDNFTARFDSSSMGRFMSPDPLAGHTEDPETLNRYVYVRNNPLNLTDPTGLDFNLQCEKQSDTCQKDNNGRLVQGTTTTTTDANGHVTSTFAATVVTSASLQDPNSGNTATVNQNGVQITTASGTSEGIFISGTAAANNVQGSGAFKDFTFDINGNCGGSCLSSGNWHTNLPAYSAVGDLLNQRGAFTIFGEDLKAFLGGGAHPYSFQYRFGGSGCSPTFSCPNSPHLSVPYDYPGTVNFDPRANVPRGGAFHVDEHGDPPHHAWDVYVGK